ncbi:MAG: DUF309 domain-containing protein [Acidobacteriota bacterium]
MAAPASDTPTALRKGRALFNAGRFFEAHEAWEEAWLREMGQTRELLQGLIQIAAGFHHALQKGQARGCVRLLESGLRHLEDLSDPSGGLALTAFRDGVARSLKRARAWERGQSTALGRKDVPRLAPAKGLRSD